MAASLCHRSSCLHRASSKLVNLVPRVDLVRQQQRHFLDSILNASLGPCQLRTLSHSKNLPYKPESVFKAISDVAGYPAFLPFTISSKIIARDEAGLPTRARLKIGYDKFGIEENWDSIVSCDSKQGTIEARSSEEASQGLFEVLKTNWKIESAPSPSDAKSVVKLEINLKFRNAVYDQMFAQVEGKVANAVMMAFEKRVKEVERQG